MSPPTIESNPLTACTRIGILRFFESAEVSKKYIIYRKLQSLMQPSYTVEMHKSGAGPGGRTTVPPSPLGSVYRSWLLRVRRPRWGATVAARRGRACARMRGVGLGGSWPERSCREDIGAKRRRDGADDWEGAPAPAPDSTAWPNTYDRNRRFWGSGRHARAWQASNRSKSGCDTITDGLRANQAGCSEG